MIPVPSGGKVWLALGHTDMRRGMRSLALQVQQSLNKDVHAGDLYVFRGRSGSLCKILWHDADSDDPAQGFRGEAAQHSDLISRTLSEP